MTNDHSSREDFLQYILQLKHHSSLVRVSGKLGRVEFALDGRVSGVFASDHFRVRGRGCEIDVDFTRAVFTRMVPNDAPVVAMNPDDPGWIFRPLWRIACGSTGAVFLGERGPSEPPISL
jgi:hypothetical protein